MLTRLSQIAEKLVFDSYNRPLVLVVPPQIIAAACILLADKFLMKLRVCPQVSSTADLKQTAIGSEICSGHLNLQQTSMLPAGWLAFFFSQAERTDNVIDISDVTLLAERMLLDCFAGYVINEE